MRSTTPFARIAGFRIGGDCNASACDTVDGQGGTIDAPRLSRPPLGSVRCPVATHPTTSTSKGYSRWQSGRIDTSAMVSDTGKLIERSKFSAYGTPFGLPAGDSNSDGAWDATDSGNVSGTPPYTIQCDADLSGTITADDATHANSITGGFQTLGRGKLSSTAIYSRLGYGRRLRPAATPTIKIAPAAAPIEGAGTTMNEEL